MEQEKKKRFRPTLTAYRALQKENDELLESQSRLVRDCDEWRDKFRALNVKAKVLERSNEHMENAQKDMRAEIARLSNALEKAEAEVVILKDRGFWARVFNK